MATRFPDVSRLTLGLALAVGAIGSRFALAEERPAAASSASPLSALLDRVSTPEQRAERAFLEHLGWRFVADPSETAIRVHGGTPCRRASLAEAHAAGDLRVLFPAAAGAEDATRFAATLASLADSISSRCAWQLLVAPAVERATRRLAESATSGRWTFPQWGVMNALIFSMDPPEVAWVRREKVCRAREKPSAAIEAFYTEDASTECYVAQTIGAYAIQYELYGPAWFDEAFLPEEIAIGQVWYFHKTPLGKSMNVGPDYPWRALFLRPSDSKEDPGAVLGRLGPMAFPGLTGILMDQEGRSRSNQNFTFVSVSPAAAASLARHGFSLVAERARELLALRNASREKFVTGAQLATYRERAEAILAEPLFREVRVYIHPFGVLTLGEMVDKMRRQNRNAVELLLYDQAREDTFFQRYRRSWKARWGRTAEAR